MTLKEFHKLLMSHNSPVFCKCGDYYVKTPSLYAFQWAEEQLKNGVGQPFARFDTAINHVFIGEDPSLDLRSQEITI